MTDVVIGSLGNRWLSAGLVWEREQKGAWVNLLTFTLDIGYGKYGQPTATWACAIKRMRKPLRRPGGKA